MGLLAVVCLPVANAGVFDKTKKQREEEKKFTAKQTAEMGIQGLQKSSKCLSVCLSGMEGMR